MKNFQFLLLLIPFLFHCTMGFQTKTLEEILYFCSTEIEYKSDKEVHGVTNYWQLPSETLERKTGDCEDYAILAMHLCEENFIESEMVIIKGNTSTHAILEVNSKWYEPILGTERKKNIDLVYERYMYLQALYMATKTWN